MNLFMELGVESFLPLIIVVVVFGLTALGYAFVQRRRYIGLLHSLQAIKIPERQSSPHIAGDFQNQKLEALGQLAGGVAHDFNNVLAIIDGYVHMAAKSVPEENDELGGYLERIGAASNRGAALTRQLLLFGRHKMAEDAVVDIAIMIREQESLLYPLLGTEINLEVRAEENLLVEGAPDGLAQIIMNLVINARDAMPEGGTIRLDACACASDDLPCMVPETEREREYVRFSVSDTGVGMDEKTKLQVFDPFFTTKKQGRGTGLGLSTVYGLVQEMNGYIDIQTEPGSGTSMRLYLPRSYNQPGVETENADFQPSLRFDGYTALVAEDEPDLLKLVCTMLEERGMEVIPAANGADALVRQDEFKGDIDFLITDVVMPTLNGVKLAELMQAVREETRVIYMSGFPANGRLTHIGIPEDAVLLAKPVAFDQLAVTLQGIVAEDELPR